MYLSLLPLAPINCHTTAIGMDIGCGRGRRDGKSDGMYVCMSAYLLPSILPSIHLLTPQ